MRTGEGVLHQRLRALSLGNASFELTELRFDEAGPGPGFPAPRRDECADLTKGEPRVLAELDQRDALSARGAVVPSSPGAPGR